MEEIAKLIENKEEINEEIILNIVLFSTESITYKNLLKIIEKYGLNLNFSEILYEKFISYIISGNHTDYINFLDTCEMEKLLNNSPWMINEIFISNWKKIRKYITENKNKLAIGFYAISFDESKDIDQIIIRMKDVEDQNEDKINVEDIFDDKKMNEIRIKYLETEYIYRSDIIYDLI